MSDQTAFSESKSVDEKQLVKGKEMCNSKNMFRSQTLNENDENRLYPKDIIEQSTTSDNLMDQEKMAYGGMGEKWKVLGYSKETGYPIVDLSQLGIDNTHKPYVPAQSKPKPNRDASEVKKPMSYSEMKGADLKKKTPSASKIIEHDPYKYKSPPLKEPKMYNKGKKVAHTIFMQLHRTNRYETIRSILYPDLNPPKYKITRKRDKLISLFRSGSKGKYDIRYLDVEKLKDIVIPEAAVLVFKYFRDIPSLPLIYDCKLKIAYLTWSITGGLQTLDRYYGGTYSETEKQKKLGYIVRWLLRYLVRLILSIKHSPPVTSREPALHLETQIDALSSELPFWTDNDCHGEMDEKDWKQFNFEYKYMLETVQFGTRRDAEKKKTLKHLKSLKNKLFNKV